jgi:hypothetical protein
MEQTKLNRKLDTDRPYGIVYGHSDISHEQDGVHFKPNGQPLEQWASPEDLAAASLVREKQKRKEDQAAKARARSEMVKRLLEDYKDK